MKKILGIHPALIILVVIFLVLNIFDWLSPKNFEQAQKDKPLAPKTTLMQLDTKNDAVFHDLNRPVNTDIQLFNYEKWYKSKVIASPANQTSIQPPPQSKPLVNTSVPIVVTSVPKRVKTEIVKKVVTTDQEQDKTNIKVTTIPKPTKSTSEPVIKPQIPSEIAKPTAEPSDIKANYLGKYNDKDRQYAFLELNGENRAVELGSMVDGETKLSAIEKDSIQLTNARTGASKTLNTQ